jgi:hypothetical protein
MHDYSANLKNVKSLSLSVNHIKEQKGEDEEEVVEEPEVIEE